MQTEELFKLPLAQIAMLQEDLVAAKAETKKYEALLLATLNERFADRAQHLRKAADKDTGTVTIEVEGFKVRADLPKRVTWDQKLLNRAVETILSWGEKPSDYVASEIKVSEAKYNAWPPAIRALFEPARTVSVGRPDYELEEIT